MQATAAQPLPRLLRVDDLVKQLDSISTDRIYELVREGKIPGAIRIGRSVRFDAQRVSDWLAAGGTAADERV